MIINHSANSVVLGRNSDSSFSLSATPYKFLFTSSSNTETQTLDSIYSVYSGSTYNNDWSIDITSKINGSKSYKIVNMRPDVADVVGTAVLRKTNDIATVRVSDGYTTKEISYPVSQSVGSTYSSWKAYASDSLAFHIKTQIESRANTKSANTNTLSLTLTNNDWTTNISRNPLMWCSDINLSSMPVAGYSSDEPTIQKSSTVISPRHVLSANHWKPTTSFWIGTDGIIYSRNILSYLRIGTTDLAIGYLDSALPAEVTPIKCMPSNWVSYLPNHVSSSIPAAFYDSGSSVLNIQKQVAIGRIGSLHHFKYSEVELREPFSDSGLIPFWTPVQFKSSSPAFVIINNEPIILGTWHQGIMPHTAVYAPFVSTYINEINAAMSSLHGSSEYQLQIVDLSGFPTY